MSNNVLSTGILKCNTLTTNSSSRVLNLYATKANAVVNFTPLLTSNTMLTITNTPSNDDFLRCDSTTEASWTKTCPLNYGVQVVASGGTTTMATTSPNIIILTGNSNSTVKLPPSCKQGTLIWVFVEGTTNTTTFQGSSSGSLNRVAGGTAKYHAFYANIDSPTAFGDWVTWQLFITAY